MILEALGILSSFLLLGLLGLGPALLGKGGVPGWLSQVWDELLKER